MMGYNNIGKKFFNFRTQMRFSSPFHYIGVMEKFDKTLPWFEGIWKTTSPNIREYNC